MKDDKTDPPQADPAHLSRVRAARADLEHKVKEAASALDGAVWNVGQAERKRDECKADLAFAELELANFNARHPQR